MPLLEPRGEGYPRFMQSDAWTDRQLASALGSWTELRHDTLLYAKQSELLATGVPSKYINIAQGYVEPIPKVLGRLASLAELMRNGLDDRDLLFDDITERLDLFITLQLDMQRIAEKELAAEPITCEDYYLINGSGWNLMNIYPPPDPSFPIMFQPLNMAVVADVHTDQNFQQVLEEAVGHVAEINVIVDVGGRLKVLTGGVYTYFEFTEPVESRLTDETWQEMLDAGEAPPLPEWTASHRIDNIVPKTFNDGSWSKNPFNPSVTISKQLVEPGDTVDVVLGRQSGFTGEARYIIETADDESYSWPFQHFTNDERIDYYQCTISVPDLPSGCYHSYVSADHTSGTWTYDIPLDVVGTISAVADNPPTYTLSVGAHPNPFNPATTITFTIPETGPATLAVYSITGQKVRDLAAGPLGAGIHAFVWDGRDDVGNPVASGVYLTRLESAVGIVTGKLALVR